MNANSMRDEAPISQCIRDLTGDPPFLQPSPPCASFHWPKSRRWDEEWHMDLEVWDMRTSEIGCLVTSAVILTCNPPNR